MDEETLLPLEEDKPKEKHHYTVDDPPPSCIECDYYTVTYSVAHAFRRTLFYDKCGFLNRYFAKMHIILRGEYRSLSKHDRDDLSKHLPYECPFFNSDRTYWEEYGHIKMGKDFFIYEMEDHGIYYKGWTVYSLQSINDELKQTIPEFYELNYIDVKPDDEIWFIETFGEDIVLLTEDYSPDLFIPT